MTYDELGTVACGPQVWLRLWGWALVLAFVTGRPLPHVPSPLRRIWPSLDDRTRECLLATIVRTAVTSRALALRHSYDPRQLTVAVTSTAADLLVPASSARDPVAAGLTPIRAGQIWVIPQLRWLHEAARLDPSGGHHIEPDDIAPPLDFGLARLPDWPGIRVGDRLDALRRHQLSMISERNRVIAVTALLGNEQNRMSVEADLAIAGIGLRPEQRLSFVARALGAAERGNQPGWLEDVLSWPSRLTGAGQGAGRAGSGDRIASGAR